MGTDRFEQEVAAKGASGVVGIVAEQCIRCMALRVIPTNTACITLRADCGPGGTNGETSFTGR